MSVSPFQAFPIYSLPLNTQGFMLVFPKHGNTLESHVEIFANTDALVSSQTIGIRMSGMQPGAKNHCSHVLIPLTGSYYHLPLAGVIIVTVAKAHITLHRASLAKTAPLAGLCPLGLFTAYLLICSPQWFSCFCSPCLPVGTCSTFKSYFYRKKNNHLLRLWTYYGESRE